ncbi:MAG: 3'-5' exonuclease [Deltaproteobacteria bacterium]|nr:3'-5' exonuclease [Deltaproteobacteria bacterium]
MIRENGCYTVFDFETTGLSPARGGRVIEIGAVRIVNGAIDDEFHSLINPGVPVPWAAQRIHGISTQMLDREPGPEEVFPQFIRYIGDSILVAHNAPFDLRFFHSELQNLGLKLNNNHLCTLKMSRKLFPGLRNYKLGTLAYHLTGPLAEDVRCHRALDDARLTAAIWLKILERNQERRSKSAFVLASGL